MSEVSADGESTADASSSKAVPDNESRQLRNAFLSGLPSFNEDNFARFTMGGGDGGGGTNSTGYKPSSRRGRPSLYVCTKDYDAEQVITTEKTNILLRYLHKQWDRKNIHVKRGADPSYDDIDDLDEQESISPKATKVSKVTGKSPEGR